MTAAPRRVWMIRWAGPERETEFTLWTPTEELHSRHVSPKALSKIAFANDATEVRHDYDLRMAGDL